MSEDKVPILEIPKLSPATIIAWKYPKIFKQTVHNQFMRCAKYYVETTIENVLPLIKTTEHFSTLGKPKSKTMIMYNFKIMMNEAREFIGNVELTKRTRGQQKQIPNDTEMIPSTSSDVIPVSREIKIKKKRKRSISLENNNTPAKRNVRKNSVIPQNCSKLDFKDSNDPSISTSTSLDIEHELVEAVQTSPAVNSAPKKCKPSEKTVESQLKTASNNKRSPIALDMPELTDFMNYEECNLTNLSARPKLVLKIRNCLSEHYRAYSDADEPSPKKPESSENVTQTIPQTASSFTKKVGMGEGIGYKDIAIMKPRRKKLVLKTVDIKSKPSVTKKAGCASKKMTKAQIMKSRQKPARDLFICSDTSDTDSVAPIIKKVGNEDNSDGQLITAQLKEPRCKSPDHKKSKIAIEKVRRKSMYEDLFGNDSDDTSSNNEKSQKIHGIIANGADGKVIKKIMIEADNMNDKSSSMNEESNNIDSDVANNIEEGSSNVINKSSIKEIDAKSNINELESDEADDSDVISLCADEDFNEDFAFEDKTTISPKKDTSSTSIDETKAWSAVLDDCRMTLRKDTESNTLNSVKPGNVTKSFNNNTKTIVKNMLSIPPIPLKPNKQQTSMLKTVFNGLCVEFINDNCKKACRQLHEFPSVFDVQNNIGKVNLTTIETAYEFIKNHPKMFLMYFPVFCEIFGFYKLPNRLKAMFTDCERQTRTIDYYRHVVAGLTKTGILRYKSIRMCIEVATDSKYARETIINMIAETGPDVVRFVDYLTHCGTLPMPMFNKIMEHCVTYQHPDLQYYLLSSFQQTLQHGTVASQVNQPNMIKLLQLIKRSQEFNNEQIERNLVNVLENFCNI